MGGALGERRGLGRCLRALAAFKPPWSPFCLPALWSGASGMFFSNNFPAFGALGGRAPVFERPLTGLGLASWPKSQLMETSKTRNPQKLPEPLWGQEQSCWEEPVWSCRFSSRSQEMFFFLKSENDFKRGFSRAKAGNFPSGDREAKSS